MADRFPLILNTSANQIQEIASGDSLDLTGTNIANAGIITAGNVIIGAATTDLIVNGDARITGILTIGTSSLKFDGPNNLVNVGTALTLGHTQGLQFHTQNLHSAGFEVNQINVSGASTIGGNLDANGNVNVTGVTTFNNNVHFKLNDKLYFGNNNELEIYQQGNNTFIFNNDDAFAIGQVSQGAAHTMKIYGGTEFELKHHTTNGGQTSVFKSIRGGAFTLYHAGSNTPSADQIRLQTTSTGLNFPRDIDVDGHTNLDNVSIAGVTTFAGTSTINNILYVKGAENTDGIIALYADEGDDNNDMWRLRAGTNSAFYIDNYANGAWQTNLAATATSTQLYSAGYVKVNTTTNGINVYNGESGGTTTINVTKGSGDAEVVCQRTGGSGIKLRGSHPASFLETTTDSDLYVRRNTNTRIALGSNGNTVYGNTTFTGNVQVGGVLTYEDVTNVDSVGIVTARDGVFIPDNKEFKIGNTAGSPDTKIFSNGSKTRLVSTVQYDMDADIIDIHNASANAMKARFLNNQVELYYANNKKFETTSSGVNVTGQLVADNGLKVPDGKHVTMGTDNDFKVYHDGTNAAWLNGTGNNYLYGSGGHFYIRPVNAENGINVHANGNVELYHDNSKKFETSSTGATVTGDLSVTGDITVPTSMDSTMAGGVGIQRFWTASISAGNVYKCGQWYTGEGAVQLLIAVRSYQPGHSGTTTYMYQGGFSAIGSLGIKRLMPLSVGTGHGNGPDNGTNSNAWEVLIDNINNYTYAVYVHVPSGVSSKNVRVTVTELGRGFNFTDLSSSVAYSSLTVSSGAILSSNYNHLGNTYLRDNYSINLGNSNDLKLFHDGSHSYIHDNGTGNLRIRGEDVEITDNASNNNMARFIEQGGVELYYNNSKHFEVTSFGAETVYSSGGGSIPIFKTLHGNRSQGIGLGYNGITAIGTNTNVDLYIKPKGTSPLYIQRDNGANMLRANPGAELILYHNGEETAQTYNTNGRKAFLVGDKAHINSGVSHGELIVRKNLGSPNNASIEQCARMTVITNEQTAGGNGYGGAVFFGAQDVSNASQYTYRLAAIGAKLHNSADLANTTPNGDLSFFCQNSSLYERGRLRHDGYLFLTNTSIQQLSDIRLKENIEDYSFDLDKFKQFKPVTFNWKKPEYHSETPKSGKHRGFIAQDVQKLDSYALVNKYDLDKDSEERELIDEDGVGLTSTLGDKDAMYVSVIQQLIDKIEKLETEVASLKGS